MPLQIQRAALQPVTGRRREPRRSLLARRLTHSSAHPALHYWHESGEDVDHVLPDAHALFALEAKSGRQRGNTFGLDTFRREVPLARPLVIGTGGVPLDTWFTTP